MSPALSLEHTEEHGKAAGRDGRSIFQPFGRLTRKTLEAAPAFWRQALLLERMAVKRTHRILARTRKATRRYIRRVFR